MSSSGSSSAPHGEALAHFEESLRLATDAGERLGIVIAQHHRGWARFFRGDVECARADFAESLDISLALGHDEGAAYGLEGFAGLRASEGDVAAAGHLLGAAQRLRRRKAILNPEAFEFHRAPLRALRDAGHGAELDAAVAEGLNLPVSEVLPHVRD